MLTGEGVDLVSADWRCAGAGCVVASGCGLGSGGGGGGGGAGGLGAGGGASLTASTVCFSGDAACPRNCGMSHSSSA